MLRYSPLRRSLRRRRFGALPARRRDVDGARARGMLCGAAPDENCADVAGGSGGHHWFAAVPSVRVDAYVVPKCMCSRRDDRSRAPRMLRRAPDVAAETSEGDQFWHDPRELFDRLAITIIDEGTAASIELHRTTRR